MRPLELGLGARSYGECESVGIALCLSHTTVKRDGQVNEQQPNMTMSEHACVCMKTMACEYNVLKNMNDCHFWFNGMHGPEHNCREKIGGCGRQFNFTTLQETHLLGS